MTPTQPGSVSDATREDCILNALPANITLLDGDGFIVSVNEEWRNFARTNFFKGPCFGVGTNYLDVCDRASGMDSSEAVPVAEGIRSVLEGRTRNFSIEYPCHSPTEQRWFLLKVTPLTEEVSDGVVVMHIDITERKSAEAALFSSQHAMRLALEAAHIGHWDLDLRTFKPKQSFLHDQIFGYVEPVADWSYERFLEHVLPQDRERVNGVFRAGVDGKAEWGVECRIVRRDGALRWIWVHGTVLTNESGNAVRTLGIVIDITDRKKSEEVTRESERRFVAAFEEAPIGMALVATDGRWLRVNRVLCEILGYSESQLLGHTFQALTHCDDIGLDLAYVQRMLSGEISTYQMEKRYIHASGQIVPALLSVSIVRDDAGKPRYFISQIQDITLRKGAESAIERGMQRLNEAQRVGRIGDWEYLPASELITWSPQMFEIFGRDSSLGPPRDYAENATLFDVSSHAFQQQMFQLTMDSGQPQDYELTARRPDGTPVYVHVLALPVQDDSGTVVRIHGTMQDISVRKLAEVGSLQLAERLATTLDSMSDAFFVVDRDWRFTFLNQQAELLLGRGRGELLGRNLWAEFPAALGSVFEREYRRALADNVTVAFEEFFESVNLFFSVRAYPSEHGLAVYFSDITQSRRAAEALRETEDRLEYLAYYDPLTGLAKRGLFLHRVSEHMRSATSSGHQLALFLIDLERFKNINDSLGRSAGDALLKQVAELMEQRGGDASLLARVGTNHFAAVLPRVRPDGDLVRLIESAMEALGSHSFSVEGVILRVTAKVGVALFPDDGDCAESVFQRAEAALKQAKASGDRYLLHSSALSDNVAGKLSLENQLRRALVNDEFVLYYQPKVNLISGKVTGAEALIRWNHPEKGLVPPGQFIPILEETGLIHEVGRWAMRKAIGDYLHWCDAGLAAVRIAVNVSSLQLRSRGFVADVAQALEIDPRAAAGLELEITESMVMGDINCAIASLQAIRSLGVTVAMDDFGTGFSSLSYLARLPLDTLKIDRSFINEMTSTPEGLALVTTIITLGHSLRHKVVAEGVETQAQSQLLRVLKCDEMQGFYFGKPVPLEVFQASYLSPSTSSAAGLQMVG